MSLTLSLMLMGAADVILTRDQAEQMSPRELEALLLANYPHRDIHKVEVGRSMEGFPAQPLSYVLLHKTGRAADGRFCTARRILVTFDTLHGKVPQNSMETAPDAPRRLFSISAAPLAAVLDGPASDARCAPLRRFAQMPQRNPERGRRVVEAVLGLSARAERKQDIAVPITCIDETTRPASGCDGERMFATLNWENLGNVDLPGSVRGPTTQLQFWQRDHWVVEVTGIEQVTSLAIRRRYPPPF